MGLYIVPNGAIHRNTLELSHQRQSGNNSTTLTMSKCLEMQQNCVELLKLLLVYKEEGKTQK